MGCRENAKEATTTTTSSSATAHWRTNALRTHTPTRKACFLCKTNLLWNRKQSKPKENKLFNGKEREREGGERKQFSFPDDVASNEKTHSTRERPPVSHVCECEWRAPLPDLRSRTHTAAQSRGEEPTATGSHKLHQHKRARALSLKWTRENRASKRTKIDPHTLARWVTAFSGGRKVGAHFDYFCICRRNGNVITDVFFFAKF